VIKLNGTNTSDLLQRVAQHTKPGAPGLCLFRKRLFMCARIAVPGRVDTLKRGAQSRGGVKGNDFKHGSKLLEIELLFRSDAVCIKHLDGRLKPMVYPAYDCNVDSVLDRPAAWAQRQLFVRNRRSHDVNPPCHVRGPAANTGRNNRRSARPDTLRKPPLGCSVEDALAAAARRRMLVGKVVSIDNSLPQNESLAAAHACERAGRFVYIRQGKGPCFFRQCSRY